MIIVALLALILCAILFPRLLKGAILLILIVAWEIGGDIQMQDRCKDPDHYREHHEACKDYVKAQPGENLSKEWNEFKQMHHKESIWKE